VAYIKLSFSGHSQTDFEKERNQAWGIEERDAVGAASELQVVSGPDPDS
jgi:hypothetical protein